MPPEQARHGNGSWVLAPLRFMHARRSQWFMFLGESREDGRLIATFSRSPRSPYSRTEQWSISLAAGIDATFTAAIAVVLHKLEVVEQQRRSAMISAALLA